MSAKVHIVGVRHHSPACARLVRDKILRERPSYVLVEGPSDMNARMEELLLPHQLPIALFSYKQSAEGASRWTWTPFCEFSPELVALEAARKVSAQALFMDLPAWDDVFAGLEDRFGRVRPSDRLHEVIDSLGFEDTDALWDHLFEQPRSMERLEDELSRYFQMLRGDEPAGDRDTPREETMARAIAAAVSACGDHENVVVVCGGFHKPALERMWPTAKAEFPVVPGVPEGTRVGSYFVPYTLRRLDSFAGYASGMPSPGYYQAVWEKGASAAAEHMLFFAIRHLRKKAQRVSPADAIAASTLAHGLRAMRGHDVLTRIDVLDGLAGALVKEALDAPLPWTRRGTLARHTDALLVELVSAFSGQKQGVLAPGTPAPPIVTDAFAELARVGITPSRTVEKRVVAVTEPKGRAESHVLHRLEVLQIPGFQRLRAPVLSRGKTDLTELWSIERTLETDPGLVTAAVYGGSLLQAARAKLEEQCGEEADSAMLAEALESAAACGISELSTRWLARIGNRVREEPSFGSLGAATRRLLSLFRGDWLLELRGSVDLALVLASCLDRGLWLLEGMRGATAPADDGHIAAVRALRDLLRHGPLAVTAERPRALSVCERRVADAEAPPAIRGAALGCVWSLRAVDQSDPVEEASAVLALRAAWRAATIGDYLAGLFALAREEVRASEPLLHAIDDALSQMMPEDFMIALPALRQAFAFFPPRERLSIAEGVLARGGAVNVDPSSMLRTRFNVEVVREGVRIDTAARDQAARFGLTDDLDAVDGGTP
jgi:hypothetical protein